MNRNQLLTDLMAFSKKHNIAFLGQVRLTALSAGYVPESLCYSIADCIDYGNGSSDTFGPFILGEACKRIEPEKEAAGFKFHILDKEKVIGDGVQSMVDGKRYMSRHSYETHLKDNGCEVVGDDSSQYRNRSGHDLGELREKLKEEGKLRRNPA